MWYMLNQLEFSNISRLNLRNVCCGQELSQETSVKLGVEYPLACNYMCVRLCVVWRLTVSFQYISIQLKQRQFDLVLEDFAYGIQPGFGHCTYTAAYRFSFVDNCTRYCAHLEHALNRFLSNKCKKGYQTF